MNIDIIKSVSLTLTEMATIGDLPDLPLLRIFSLLQYPDIISAGQTCLRWASLCHPLWAKIAEEIVESWSQEKFIPSEENIRIATILHPLSEVTNILYLLALVILTSTYEQDYQSFKKTIEHKTVVSMC